MRVTVVVSKIDSELSSGLTIRASLSSGVTATVDDFDGRRRIAAPVGASGVSTGGASTPASSPTIPGSSLPHAATANRVKAKKRFRDIGPPLAGHHFKRSANG